MNGPAQATRGLSLLLAIVLVVAGLRLAQDVLVPLAIAVLLAFLLAPLVERLQRLHVNGVLAVMIAVTFAFAIIGTLAWVVFDQLTDLVKELPQYRQHLRHNIAEIRGFVQGGMGSTANAVEQITAEIQHAAPAKGLDAAAARAPMVQVVQPPPTALAALAATLGPLLKPLATAALVVVFVIFMLLKRVDLRDRFIRLLGARNLQASTVAIDDAATRVTRFLLMQTLVNGTQGIVIAVGLWLIGVPNAALWGALTFSLRFIPYAGPWVAAAMPIALSFAVFSNWQHPAMTVALFAVVELLTNTVMEPWLYGSQTGVSSVALLVAAAFWAWLWGPAGLFLAIPLTVCLVVMGKYIPQLEFLHVLLGDQPVLQPHERLYQRLLARNREEADDIIEAALREGSAAQVCDALLVPAIQLAKNDYERGALDDEHRRAILDHFADWADGGFEGHVADATAAESLRPLTRGVTVLLVPAADEADDLVARLLGTVIVQLGGEATVLPLVERRASPLERLRSEGGPYVAIVSAVPPDTVTAARAAVRRVAAAGRMPVIVGLWSARGDVSAAEARLRSAGAQGVVTTFTEALEQLRALADALAQVPAPTAKAIAWSRE